MNAQTSSMHPVAMAQSHHHQLSSPPFRSRRCAAQSTNPCLPSHRGQSMPLAVHLATDLEVVVPQHASAVMTGKAMRMELSATSQWGAVATACGLQILSFDAQVAAVAERAVGFVVVLFAVGLVVDHIEICGLEGFMASFADEAFFVPTSCQSAVSGLH